MENKAKDLISTFYQQEEERLEHEKGLAQLGVRISSSDRAMLEVISARFNKNEDELARDALSGAIYNMFEALETKERKQLAKDADDRDSEIIQTLAEENGVSAEQEKPVTWVMNDRAVTRAENKARKAAEKDQPESTPEENTSDNIANEVEQPSMPETEASNDNDVMDSETVEANAEQQESTSLFL